MLATFATVWLTYSNVVFRDIFVMAAGQSLAVAVMSFAAFAFSRSVNSKLTETERNEKAARVAWIALFVVLVALGRPLMPI